MWGLNFVKRDRLKLHALWNSLANNTGAPFVGFFEAKATENPVLIGYVVAISTLASAITQLLGGRIADKTGRRVALAFLFSVVAGVLWVIISVLEGPILLAVAFTAITLASGFYLAGWTSLLGEASENTQKGSFLSSFARIQSVGGLVALLMSTTILFFNGTAFLPYLLSGGFFLVSALVLRGQQEQRVVRSRISEAGVERVKRFYFVSGVYGLFWGFAWPLFLITLVTVVNMSPFEFGVSQVIAVASTIAFQPLAGRLVDSDRRKWVFWTRMALTAYPLTYMFFSAAWQVYVINVFAGFTNALLNVAFTAYLFDISPTGQRGWYSATFNLLTGATTVAGSLTAGFLLGILKSSNSLWLSLAYLYVVAACGRALAALLHLGLPRGTEAPVAGPGLASSKTEAFA